MPWSWGVANKISMLPSTRGFLKNHAQLQFSKEFPLFEKFVSFGLSNRIKPKSGKHARAAREPCNSSYISKVELAN